MYPSGSSASGSPYFPNTVGSLPARSSPQLSSPFQTAYAPSGDPFSTAFTPRPLPQSPAGHGSPSSSSYMEHNAGVTGRQAGQLVRSLRENKEAEAAQAALAPVPVAARGAYAGDRGFLSSDVGASWPGSPQTLAATAASPAELTELAQEVTAKEMELKVLRQQAETTQRDADRLRSQLRDANLHLTQASGSVSTLSAKVEATAGRVHTVLDASAQRMQEQIMGYRRRLERMKCELTEKDEDIQHLQRVIVAGNDKVSGHRDRVTAAQQATAQDFSALDQGAVKQAAGNMKEVSLARIEQEKANTVLARERRAALEQLDALDADVARLQDYIRNAEQKGRHHATESVRRQQHLDAMLMEERMVASVAQLGAERALEQRRHGTTEAQLLEQRIGGERSKKATKSGKAQAYDAVERDAAQGQAQLQALTEFVRLVSQTLRGPDGTARGRVAPPDRVDHEVDAWIRRARQSGAPVPPIERVGPGEYMVGGQPLHATLSSGGKLCARMPDGGLLPMDDYFRAMEELRRQEATSTPSMQSSMAPPAYVDAGPKPLHALVSPMNVRGAAVPQSA